MKFSYRDYVSEHGKMPRGYGSWAFATNPYAKPEDVYWVVGMFAEAKRKAREHFKGEWVVFVLA